MGQNKCIWMSWCLIHPSLCGARLLYLMPSLLIVGDECEDLWRLCWFLNDTVFLYQLHMASVSPRGEQVPTKTILKLLMERKLTFYLIQLLVAKVFLSPLWSWSSTWNPFFPAQLCRVSHPRLTGLPPEWHLHRSVKLLCSPPGHRRETSLLATHLPSRVSTITTFHFYWLDDAWGHQPTTRKIWDPHCKFQLLSELYIFICPVLNLTDNLCCSEEEHWFIN